MDAITTLPEASEHAPSYSRYVSLVGTGPILSILEDQPRDTVALLSRLSDEQSLYRYAPDKWSIKETLGHVIDTERIFAYRALRIARNDPTPMEGFEQDDYVRNSNFDACPLIDLLDEFTCVRQATICLLHKLAPSAWVRRGIANNNEISVRAIAYVVAGHELHHRQVLQEKYLNR